MIGLDMVYVSYFGDFLDEGSRESLEYNILFRLSPARTASRPPRKAVRPPRKSLLACHPAAKKMPIGQPPGRQENARKPGRKSLQARPSFERHH